MSAIEETDASAARRLSGAIQHDALSEILQVIRFRSMFICRSELGAPWGFRLAGRDFANFHILLQGKCCLDTGADNPRIWLTQGDLVVLPHGGPHVMRDAPDSPTPSLEDLIAGAKSYRRGTLQAGGDGARSILLCGGFNFEERATNPLLSALPAVIHLQGRRPGVEAWVRTVFDFLARESAAALPGAETVITRLADILFIEAVREYFASPGSDKLGLAVALRDPRVGAVLASVHRNPERDWKLDALSKQAGMSRTAFATRFSALVGEPPLRYVTRCRINKAAAILRADHATIQQVAERVGYESELGFSRAFKRFLGTSPAAYREASRVAPALSAMPTPI